MRAPPALTPRSTLSAHDGITSHTLLHYCSFNAEHVLDLAARRGAVLFRGWPDVRDDESVFGGVGRTLGLEVFRYVGGAAPRTRVAGDVFTANDSPPDSVIPFHHELGHARVRPSHLCFHCRTPARTGGETLLLDSRALAAHVARAHPAQAARLDAGVRYARTMPDATDAASPIGRSWRDVFGCRTREAAEEAMRAGGIDEWRWDDDDGSLWTLTAPVPAFGHDARYGRATFANSILAARLGWRDARNRPEESVRYADDGAPLDGALVRDLIAWSRAHAHAHRWKRGDILLVDNGVAMHARAPYTGTRVVLTTLHAGPAARAAASA